MSWIDDASFKELVSAGYFAEEFAEESDDKKDNRFYVLKNGTEICNNCGSRKIKVSKAGNKYCADFCWVDIEDEE